MPYGEGFSEDTRSYEINEKVHPITKKLTGKVALVTGGSRSIGAAIDGGYAA